jgi:D-inositol-3-phosphate glycosyltransferase
VRLLQVSGGEVRIPAKTGGAIEAFIFSISKQLAEMGHEVTILDRQYSDADPITENMDGIRIVRLNARRFHFNSLKRVPLLGGSFRQLSYIFNQLAFISKVRGYLLKTDSYDVIHVHDTGGGFLLALMDRNSRGKLVYTCHSSRRAGDSINVWDRIVFLMQDRLVKWVPRVTVPSDLIRTKLIDRAGISPDKIVLLDHDVDTDLLNPGINIGDIRQKYGLDGKTAILFVGRIHPDKGVEYLVKAASITVNQHACRDVMFLLVGPTGGQFNMEETAMPNSYLAKIQNLIKECGLQQNVNLTGTIPVDDLRKLYAVCHMFVLPSLVDLSPRAILEAMACGKPVIGSRVGGIPVNVRNEESGFLVDPADEDQLAQKMKYLIDNPEEAKRMGALGRRIVEEKFSSRKTAQRLIHIYQRQAQ